MKTMGKARVALQSRVSWHSLPEHLSCVPRGSLMWDALITSASSPHFVQHPSPHQALCLTR